MILPDVNVLIGAFRADHPHHTICRRWLTATLSSPGSFGLSTLILAALIRVSTNPRIFVEPSSTNEAIDFCESLTSHPIAEILEPGPNHWPLFTRLCREAKITGPLVTDAWFAALAIEHGCEWITLDRDFSRFPGFRWSVPA